MERMRLLLGISLTLSVLSAQPKRLEFEVASIKTVEASADPSVKVGVQIDGSQIHLNMMSLRDLVQAAYNVKFYQVLGQEWMAGQRFNVSAKLPEGAKRDQLPDMLLAMLQDRFELKAHREPKEMGVYGLTVLPGGSKMKEIPNDPGFDPAKSAVQVNAQGGPGGVSLSYGPESYFKFADQKIEGRKLSMLNFVDVLGRFTDRPIIDETKLPARYDLDVQLTENDYYSMLIRSALSAGIQLPPQALRLLDSADGSLGFALKPLGLKMESKKAPIDCVMVDSIRKAPTDN
jgi:uncharacterized protein (TIGR03435 family)